MAAGMRWLLATTAMLMGIAAGKTFFSEKFDNLDSWVTSSSKNLEGPGGKFVLSPGKFYGDKEEDKGLMTSQDAKHYAISAKIQEPVETEGKPLVIQYSYKMPEFVDCGGGYIKLMRKGLDQNEFSGSSPYAIMFGVDICGTTTRKIHAILNYDDKNFDKNVEVPCMLDRFTHFITFIIRPDNTYTILSDNEEKASGSLAADWGLLKPKTIPDPSATKPSNWVEEPMMDDASDKKPSDWVEEAEIVDTDSTKPDDWDDDADGIWEAPKIANPAYKGQWSPKRIKNPDYKGSWAPPQIPNPDFVDDPNLYLQKDIEYIGFELWQVKSGWIFDNVLVADDPAVAGDAVAAWLKTNGPAEKKMNDEQETAERIKREKDRKDAESSSSKPTDDDDDDDDIDLDDDDDKDEL